MFDFSIDNLNAKIDKATSCPIKVGAIGIVSVGISFVYTPIIPVVACASFGLFIGSVVNKLAENKMELVKQLEESEKDKMLFKLDNTHYKLQKKGVFENNV